MLPWDLSSWYVRNSALDSRNTFQPARSFTNLHNYGITAGAPHHSPDRLRGHRFARPAATTAAQICM